MVTIEKTLWLEEWNDGKRITVGYGADGSLLDEDYVCITIRGDALKQLELYLSSSEAETFYSMIIDWFKDKGKIDG